MKALPVNMLNKQPLENSLFSGHSSHVVIAASSFHRLLKFKPEDIMNWRSYGMSPKLADICE